MIEKEIWKPIKDYEDLYEISNLGRVRSVTRNISYVNNGTLCTATIKGFLRTPTINRKGYYQIKLNKNNKFKSKLIHRLVAEAFIPNPNYLPQINHKDENKQNNCVDNLEWCTNKYNCNYGTHPQNCSKRSKEPSTWLYKPIIQLTLTGEFVKEWPCINNAAATLNIDSSCIISCCKGYRMNRGHKCQVYSAGGFKWKYKNNQNDKNYG